MHRIVLDARAIARFLEHLEVVHGALAKSRGLQHLALGFELLEPLFELLFDILDRRRSLSSVVTKCFGRVDIDFESLDQEFAGQRVDLDDALDLVAEELHAQGDVLVGGKNFQRIASHPERAADESHVVAVVLDVDQVPNNLIPPRLTAAAK